MEEQPSSPEGHLRPVPKLTWGLPQLQTLVPASLRGQLVEVPGLCKIRLLLAINDSAKDQISLYLPNEPEGVREGADATSVLISHSPHNPFVVTGHT